MSYSEESDFNIEKINSILSALERGEHPYLDTEEVEEVFDYIVHSGNEKHIELFTEYAVSLHPDDPDVLMMRANALLDNNKFNEAEKILLYLESLSNVFPGVYISHGWLNIKQNKMEAAYKCFDKCVELCNCWEDDLFITEIALNLNSLNHHKEAERYARIFLEKYPNDPDCLFELAYACEKNDKEAEALEVYDKLLEISPFMESAWYNKGVICMRKENFESALNAFKTTVAINPNNAEAYFNMGNTYMGLKDVDEALNNYTEYISLCPPDELELDVYQYIGECWEQKENNDLAYRFFYEAAYNKTPDNSTAWYGLAYNAMQTNKLEEAQDAALKAININNEIPEYYFLLADIFNTLELYQQEAFVLLRGLELNPKELDAWEEIYCLIYDTLKTQKARVNLNHEMRQVYGDIPELDYLLAFIYLNNKPNNKKGLEIIERLAENNPEFFQEVNKAVVFRMILDNKETKNILKKHNIIL